MKNVNIESHGLRDHNMGLEKGGLWHHFIAISCTVFDLAMFYEVFFMASKSLRGLVSDGSELALLQDLLSCLRTVGGCVQGRILLHICYRDAPFCPTILPELCLYNFFFLVSDLLIWKLLIVHHIAS